VVKRAKTNCWEFMKCGREPGGRQVDLRGVCPAAVEAKADGINGGERGGRACWAIAGTLCNGEIQGTFAMKLPACLHCDFYKLVLHEEGDCFQSSKEILHRLKY